MTTSMSTDSKRRDRWRRYWDKHSRSYDREMRLMDRVLFKDSRRWVCSKASGRTLEVAIGTGLNLPFYPAAVQLTGIDLSPAMLRIARIRAAELGKPVDIREADAQALPFADDAFDSVVCTFSLCAIPDERRAVSEMARVLRPGGRLLLADHIASSNWLVRSIQRLLEIFTVPLQGEHFLRRPLEQVRDIGMEVEERERFSLGLVERIAASTRAVPTPSHAADATNYSPPTSTAAHGHHTGINAEHMGGRAITQRWNGGGGQWGQVEGWGSTPYSRHSPLPFCR